MAENESLDLGRSLRWRRVLTALLVGQSTEHMARLVDICIRRTVNALREPATRNGPCQVRHDELFEAWERGPQELRRAVREHQGHDFAVLFSQSTAGAASREDAAVKYLGAIVDKYFDQIKHRSMSWDGVHSVLTVSAQLEAVRARLEPDMKRYAANLARSPKKSLVSKRGASRGRVPAFDTESVLKESLIGLGHE